MTLPPASNRRLEDRPPLQPSPTDQSGPDAKDDDGFLEELTEIPEELAGAATAVGRDVEGSWLAQRSVHVYFWLMDRAPESTRGRLILAAVIFVVALAPSAALLYVSLAAGQAATENWFGKLGYLGIFLSNFAGSATLFIPVPGLTAAGQALIASSSHNLSAFWVGVIGGLGMAIGEITAYVAGMAGALIAQEEEFKPPQRFEKPIRKIVSSVNWLMAHYGMPTLFILAAVPNVFFEVAGLTAGATRFAFWKFMTSVTAGKIVRGLLLAYVGEKLIFG